MSDLQLALIGIGVVVVAGVYGFNWLQQRKYRREAAKAFGKQHEDVLLGRGGAAMEDRVEPRLGAGPALEERAVVDSSGAAAENLSPAADEDAGFFDGAIDYVTEIRPANPVAAAALGPLLQHKFDFDKPVRVLGWNQSGAKWEEPGSEAGAAYSRIRVALQLADRAGPVSELKLAEFRDLVRDVAIQLQAEAECPEPDEAHAQAALLDGFCAEVDVMIGINVVSRDGAAFPGTKIRAMAEAAGFRLAPDGTFRCLGERGEHLYSLQNLETSPFAADTLKTLATRGITLLLDVPRVAGGARVFDRLVALGRQFAGTLGGTLVDDNRVPLNDSGLARIRTQIEGIQARMAAQGIQPGGALALRLFS